MSDVELVLGALPRIRDACAARMLADGPSGATVTAHQAKVLGFLDRDDPTMVGELAEYLGVTPSTMSLTLRRLRDAGLVTMERDPADRRAVNVRLTEAGERLAAAGAGLDAERVAALLRLLAPETRAEALRGLAALAEAAGRLIARGPGPA